MPFLELTPFQSPLLIYYQTAKVASNCIRTLLLQPKKTAADMTNIKYLLPRLISFLSNTSSEDPERARSLISHALTTYMTTLPKAQIGYGMALLIPTLLNRTGSEGGDDNKTSYTETSARLLELAAADQVAFRGVVAGMTPTQKAFMEEVITSGRGQGPVKKAVSDGDGGEPSIALRMNFGGS